MSKRFWAIIAVIGLIFVGFLIYDSNKNPSGSAAQATNHLQGNTTSKVKLVEYGDFQCPVCGAYYPTVSQVVQKYEDKITFQFRNFPLTQVHPNAFAAARAAEAANKQGKFWEMYDLLFQNQTAWSQLGNAQPQFERYASQLGLNAATFKADFASDSVNKAINNDIAAFNATKAVPATPTFFLNGKQIKTADLVDANKQPSVAKFSALIDKALKKDAAAQTQSPPADR